MRKYCASLLVAAQVASTVGIFSSLYLGLHRSWFQESVVESSAYDPNVERLFFSDKDFFKIEWIEEHKEFEYKGSLYDVSKIERTADGYEIYCVNDSIEESFVAMVDQWKKSNLPTSKAKTIFQPQFCNRIDFESADSRRDFHYEFVFKPNPYSSPIGRIPSPPPKGLI